MKSLKERIFADLRSSSMHEIMKLRADQLTEALYKCQETGGSQDIGEWMPTGQRIKVYLEYNDDGDLGIQGDKFVWPDD